MEQNSRLLEKLGKKAWRAPLFRHGCSLPPVASPRDPLSHRGWPGRFPGPSCRFLPRPIAACFLVYAVKSYSTRSRSFGRAISPLATMARDPASRGTGACDETHQRAETRDRAGADKMKAAYAGFEARREHGRARSPEKGNRESLGRLEAPGDHRPASLNGRDDRDGRAKRTEVAAPLLPADSIFLFRKEVSGAILRPLCAMEGWLIFRVP